MSSVERVREMLEPILVRCEWCNKTHAAHAGEKPCGPRAWREDATGIVWEDAEAIRSPQPVSYEGAVALLFSGMFDHLTCAEFAARFPLADPLVSEHEQTDASVMSGVAQFVCPAPGAVPCPVMVVVTVQFVDGALVPVESPRCPTHNAAMVLAGWRTE